MRMLEAASVDSTAGLCPLGQMLERERLERGDSCKTLAACLEISTTYLAVLRKPGASFERVSESILRRCATYLNRPFIVVKMAAGHVSASDWQMPNLTDEQALGHAIRRLSKHPRAISLAKLDLPRLPIEVQRALVEFASETMGENLLAGEGVPRSLSPLHIATRGI
jgi:hypothetical protein